MKKLSFRHALYAVAPAAAVVALLPRPSLASPPTLLAACASNPWANIFGFQPWYACLQQKHGETKLTSLNDIYLIIFPLVDSLIKVAALVAVGVLFFMIINMVMARGDAGKIKSAVEGMRDAIIGLIICLVAVAIVNFVAGAFSTSSTPSAQSPGSSANSPQTPQTPSPSSPPVANTPTTPPSNNQPTTPAPNPPSTPTPSGSSTKPSGSNTGVLSGTTLVPAVTDAARGISVASNGNVKITKPGVFTNLLIKGRLEIKADNVTIRNSRIEANPSPWDLAQEPKNQAECQAFGGNAPPAVAAYDRKNILIEDSEIAAVRKSTFISNGIHGSGYTLRRVDISGTVDGAGIFSAGAANVLIENSYIHDLFQGPYSYGHGCDEPSHTDGIQIHYGSGITIRNNTINAKPINTSQSNAAIMLNQNGGLTTRNVTIANNWMDYGTCTVNVSQNGGSAVSGLTLTNNIFGKNSNTFGGRKCPMIVDKATRALSGNNFNGNVWEDGSSPPPEIRQGN